MIFLIPFLTLVCHVSAEVEEKLQVTKLESLDLCHAYVAAPGTQALTDHPCVVHRWDLLCARYSEQGKKRCSCNYWAKNYASAS